MYYKASSVNGVTKIHECFIVGGTDLEEKMESEDNNAENSEESSANKGDY